jgi:ribonuclease D
MNLVKKTMFATPSREDAWDITRSEKMSILFLMNTVSAMMDSREELANRVSRIDGGKELMDTMVESSEKLLTEIRRTIPEDQRMSLNNISKDMEMRMVAKMTPSKTTVLVQKEDFRQLVDAAQVKCLECVDDNEQCKRCGLFKLLKNVVPLETYEGTMLCPYNMAGWEN